MMAPIAPTAKAKDMSWVDGNPGMQQLSQPPIMTAVMECWTTHLTNDDPHSRNPHTKAKDVSWIDSDPGMQQLSQPLTTTAVMERWTTHRTIDGPHSHTYKGKRRITD